jgi:hypothetical protein
MRRLARIAVEALATYLALSLVIAFGMAELTLHPRRLPLPDRARIAAAYAPSGADLQPVVIQAADGVELHAWYSAPEHQNGTSFGLECSTSLRSTARFELQALSKHPRDYKTKAPGYHPGAAGVSPAVLMTRPATCIVAPQFQDVKLTCVSGRRGGRRIRTAVADWATHRRDRPCPVPTGNALQIPGMSIVTLA